MFALIIMHLLVIWQVIPPGLQLLTALQSQLAAYFYVLIMVIILLESIVYVGFYFPGQFFAVVMVISASPRWVDVGYLTLAMVAAATLGSAINYCLGRLNSHRYDNPAPTQLKHLLLAMIHMNSLAFFMFAQGANHRPFRIVWWAGIINLPYYLLLIAATAYMSDEVMHIAENTVLLFSLLGIWLAVALFLDIKRWMTGSGHPTASGDRT